MSNMEIILLNIIHAYFHWNIHQTCFPPFNKIIVRYTINYIFNSISTKMVDKNWWFYAPHPQFVDVLHAYFYAVEFLHKYDI